jgi:uncharacterized repeat protein (TIGR01451 family)
VFNSLRPTTVFGRSSATLSRSRLATLARVPALVILSGLLSAAVAQTRPVGQIGSDAGTAGQNQTSGSDQTQASPVADPGQTQGLVHIVPFGRGSAGLKNASAPAGAHLTYFGGPVISNVQVVVVFWGTSVISTITDNGAIDQFYTDITNSRFFDLLTEYTTAGVTSAGGVTSNQSIGRGTLVGKFTINPAMCPGGPTACTVTDMQIRAELINQINAGHLPGPQSDAQGIINTYYATYFPPNVSIQLDANTNSCVTGGFCAYHSNTASANPASRIPYGVVPDFSPPSGCSRGCGGGTQFQNITSVSSHELSEAVTDAQVGSANVLGPPLAWYDPDPAANPLGEIGDICNAQDIIVTAGAKSYAVQAEFSNLQADCVSAPPVFNLSAPAVVTQGISTNIPLTIQSSLTAGTLTGYLGTVHFTSSDTLAILPADYTFTGSDAGTHTFPFTLKTLGSQNITAADVRSAGFTGTATFNVANGVDFVISKAHTGNFAVGQTGATYTITVTNAGTAPSGSGVAVTVTDSLPAGLNATAFAGTGWACSALPALNCTRSDSLAAGASYPPLTLIVDVTVASPTTVTNSAAVSGGNDSNTNNNTALDQTAIGPRPPSDLTISSFHGSSFIQGQTGAYTITVGNSGPAATFGQVTVTDTLPAGLTGASVSGTGWSCSAATAVPLTCTRSDVLAATNTYPQITLVVNVAPNATSPVTHSVSVSGGNDGNSANNTANDVTQIIVNGPDLQVAPLSSSGSFSQGQTGAQALFVVSNQGSAASSGTVTVTTALSAGLTATAISGPGWSCTLATLSCTRSDSLAVAMGFAAITITFDVVKTAVTNSSITMTVSGGNDANTANNTGTFGVIVTPAIAITLQGTGTATVNAGAPASYNLSLTLGSAAGTVTFSCSGLPTGAVCNFNPPSLTTSGSEVVTISTTSRTASVPFSLRRPDLGPPQLLLLVLAVSLFILLALSNGSARRRFAPAAASLVLLWTIGGCGGGGGSTGGPTPVPTPTPNPNGTPVGTYAITVTASGSSSPAAQSLILVVK